MTTRFEFGAISDTHEGSERGQRGQGPDKMTTEAKRERATANGYKFYENMHMQCA